MDYNFIQPDHYKDSDGKDYIDELIEKYGPLRAIQFCEDNAGKYRRRIGKKPGEAEEKERKKIQEYEARAEEIKRNFGICSSSLVKDMLQDCLSAFNEIPRKKIQYINTDTYKLAARIGNILPFLKGTPKH